MPVSLKVMLAKLKHKGQINIQEYEDFLSKLEGHDRQIREKGIDDLEEYILMSFDKGLRITKADKKLSLIEKKKAEAIYMQFIETVKLCAKQVKEFSNE